MAGQREKINWMDPNKFMWGPSKTEQLSPERARGQQIMESQGADKAADYWRRIEKEKAAKNASRDENFWEWLMREIGIKKR